MTTTGRRDRVVIVSDLHTRGSVAAIAAAHPRVFRALGAFAAAGHILDVVQGVWKSLVRAGVATSFYVFGHTHAADDRPLGDDPDAPRYLNPGTWSSLVRPGRDGAGNRRRYVEIEHGGGAPPTARPARWSEGPG